MQREDEEVKARFKGSEASTKRIGGPAAGTK